MAAVGLLPAVLQRLRTEQSHLRLRVVEGRTEDLLSQKQILLQEMEHRVANSLQIIASILMLKARGVASEEVKDHLRDAQQRVMSVAAVQSHLLASSWGDEIEVGPYLTTLCESLARSMIYDKRPVGLSVQAGAGMATSAVATSLGLIVIELVINALKYAFAEDQVGQILVTYTADADRWTLSVVDDGLGMQPGPGKAEGGGLGSSLIAALADQVGARVEHTHLEPGFMVAVVNAGVDHPPPERRRMAAMAARPQD